MPAAQELIEYYKTPRIKIDPELRAFFDEVYSLSSYELIKKVNELTKGSSKIRQLLSLYSKYIAYMEWVSTRWIKTLSDDEMTTFKRQHDKVRFNDLTVISLHENELVYESFSLLNQPDSDVYLRETFIELLNGLIQDEYQLIYNYKACKTSPNSDKPNFSFVNNFDTTDPDKIYTHFISELVSKNYMTKESLENYLKCAFEHRRIPETLFVFSNLEKQKITKVFYKYYELSGKKHGKQMEYVKLLGDYFRGFESKSLYTNFNK